MRCDGVRRGALVVVGAVYLALALAFALAALGLALGAVSRFCAVALTLVLVVRRLVVVGERRRGRRWVDGKLAGRLGESDDVNLVITWSAELYVKADGRL